MVLDAFGLGAEGTVRMRHPGLMIGIAMSYRFWYNDWAYQVKRLPAAFYELPSGRQPVREWLLSLSKDDRRIIGEDVKDIEFAWPIGMPLCRPLGKGLWEVRSEITQGRTARVVFCVHAGYMVLLHGFIKKSQKTPAGDLNLALKRMSEIAS